MYTIWKEFHFSAAHQLHGLPDDHPCSRVHGHNYIVKVLLSGNDLDETGFIRDFNDLKPLKRYIDDELDHRNLNDILDVQTSAENIAKHLFDWCKVHWPEVSAIQVSETPKCWAEYRE